MEECYSSLVLAVYFPGVTKKYHESSNSFSPMSIKAAKLYPHVEGELNDEEATGWEDKMQPGSRRIIHHKPTKI
jgi:hypothetical protein